MRKLARTLIPFAAAAVFLGAAPPAYAGSQLFKFTYTPTPTAASHYQTLGPGGARRVRGELQPFDGPSVLSSGDIIGVVISNPPGCGSSAVSTEGFDFSCDWPEPCFDPGESVTICFQTDKGPLQVVRAFAADSDGDSIAPVSVLSGPFVPDQDCAEVLDCTGAFALIPNIWPPNHELIPVTITGITSLAGPVTITATQVTQDEPVNARGDGNTCPDAMIADGVAHVRMERSGLGNGRVYEVSFSATDGFTECEGTVSVCVVHEQDGSTCIDDGQIYPSVIACKGNGRTSPDPISEIGLIALEANGTSEGVAYSIPGSSDVLLTVYDVAGRRVATLVDGAQPAGEHEVSWSTSGLASGIYFYRLRVGGSVVTKTIRIVR